MKQSNYNIIIPINDKQYFLMNTYRCSADLISAKIKDKIEKINIIEE